MRTVRTRNVLFVIAACCVISAALYSTEETIFLSTRLTVDHAVSDKDRPATDAASTAPLSTENHPSQEVFSLVSSCSRGCVAGQMCSATAKCPASGCCDAVPPGPPPCKAACGKGEFCPSGAACPTNGCCDHAKCQSPCEIGVSCCGANTTYGGTYGMMCNAAGCCDSIPKKKGASALCTATNKGDQCLKKNANGKTGYQVCQAKKQECATCSGACFSPVTASSSRQVTITNNCPKGKNVLMSFSKWTSGEPANKVINAGASVTMNVSPPDSTGMPSARIEFYPEGVDATLLSGKFQFLSVFELTIDGNNLPKKSGGAGMNGTVSADVSAVDLTALPMSLSVSGGNCCTQKSECNASLSSVQKIFSKSCPANLLKTNKIKGAKWDFKSCWSPTRYCSSLNNADKGSTSKDPICDPSVSKGIGKQLVDSYNQCVNDGVCPKAAVRPYDIYGCAPVTGPMHSSPMCAMLNRGLYNTATKGNTYKDLPSWYLKNGCGTKSTGPCNSSNFYVNEPYNPYSHMVHTIPNCGNQYGFAYDDQGGHGGAIQCRATKIDVTLCPSG